MSNDESPVDVAANAAAAPGDPAPRASDAAEPAAAPSRRRRTPAAPRAPRARKTSAKTDVPAESQAAPAPAEPVIEPASFAPISAAPQETEAPAAPARRPARRGSRKAAAPAEIPAAAPVEPAPVAVDAIPAQPAAVAPSEPPAEAPAGRTRRGARRKPEPAPEAVAPTDMEAPVAEAPSAAPLETAPDSQIETEPTARGRRRTARTTRTTRGGRGRGKAAAETVETMAPVVEATLQEPEPAAIEPASPEAPAEPVARRGRRGAATTRRKAEPQAEPQKGARLVSRKGVVDLVINGQTYPPVLFFGNMEGPKEQRKVASEVQRAAQSGVHIHSTLVELICPLPPDDTVYETLDTRLQGLLDADPQGFLIPRIVFVPAPGWRKQYPNEVNHYADGSTDDPSIASDLFWREAEFALRAVVEHVRRMTYGERVIGYHLERGEWFHPADGGYDRSYANREAFRTWLRLKYKNSEAALRASWYDGQVQFYTAEIPPAPSSLRSEMAFFEPRRDRRYIDFLEYTSDITADRLISLAKSIKEASEGQSLVSVCYGYTFEFGHTFSGHLSLGRVLDSPAIDIIAGPPSYRDRQAGGAGSLPAPVHSCAIHGKLWVTEDDTKTYLGVDSPDDFNPRIENRFLTEQVEERAIGKTLANQTGIAWMDTWGEGWLDAGDVWDPIKTGVARYNNYLHARKQPAPEVAFIVGEKSLLHVQRGEEFVRRVLQEHREMAQRLGASVGFYLQSDLNARNFPTDAKLYVFLTPYRLTTEQRAAVKEKLQNGGKTLVWLYAPGACDARGEPGESPHDLIGMTLRQQSWNSEIGSRLVESRHPIVQNTHLRHIGARERLNPSFYVDDDSPRLVTLAEYQQTGLPSIAVRETDNWRSVFCGEPVLTLDLLRGLCRYAGVHLYTVAGEDYLFAGDGWLTLHAVRDGQKTLFLPVPTAVFDVTENRFLGEDLREVRFFAKAKTTHRLCCGTMEMLRKLGFQGVEKAPRTRRGRGRLAEAAAEPQAAENLETLADMLPPTETAAPFEPAEDDESLDEGDDMEVSDDEPGDESAETNGAGESEADRRRRRRRRGGRGRGRRGGRGTGASAGETPAGP